MDIQHWWFLTKETLRPENGTWVVMLLPLIAGIVMILYYRSKNPNAKGAWSELGRRWAVIGASVFIIAAISYSAFVYKASRDNLRDEYIRRLKDNSKNLFDNLDFGRQMDWLIRNCNNNNLEGKDGLRECILDRFKVMKPEERHKFMKTIHSMSNRRPIIYNYQFYNHFFDPLYWPPEKIEDFRKKTGLEPAITDTLKFTAVQEEYYKLQDKEKLHKSLNNEQWAYLIGQLINQMDQDELASFIKDAVLLNENVGADNETIAKLRNGDTESSSHNIFIKKGLKEAVLMEMNDPPKECAFLAGVPDEHEIFAFFINWHNWLRELPYLLIYVITGTVMIISGLVMLRQGKKPFLTI